MRYQLPFFIFGGVLLGCYISKMDRSIGISLTVLLYGYSLPYALLNNMRPVIGMKPWPTRIESVFHTPREEVLFAHFPIFRDEFAWLADRINESQCDKVGLFLKASEFEYLFWWLREAPQSGIELQHISTTPETEKSKDHDFMRCAVICTICGRKDEVSVLPIVADYGSVQLSQSKVMNPISVTQAVPDNESGCILISI